MGPADFVSVVLPAADERDNIPILLERLERVLEAHAKRHEVIVVVPTPEDPTGAAAKEAGAEVLVQKRPGYGGALKEGILAARGDYIVTMDADLSHPPEKIADLLRHRDEAEVVVCSRYVPGASATSSWPRSVLSRIRCWQSSQTCTSHDISITPGCSYGRSSRRPRRLLYKLSWLIPPSAVPSIWPEEPVREQTNLLWTSLIGQIIRSCSLNSKAIRLKQSNNLIQSGLPSLRSLFSDSLLARLRRASLALTNRGR